MFLWFRDLAIRWTPRKQIIGHKDEFLKEGSEKIKKGVNFGTEN